MSDGTNLCPVLLIQLHGHQCRCALLAHCGVPALPEEVAAPLLPGCRHTPLLRVLPLPDCTWADTENYITHSASLSISPNATISLKACSI